MSMRQFLPLNARKAARRVLNRTNQSPPSADRLEFFIIGESAVIKLRLSRAKHVMYALLLRSRSGGFSSIHTFGEADADGMHVAHVDLAQLVRHDNARDALDLFVLWDRSSTRGGTSSGSGKQLRERLGQIAETTRPPCSQHATVDGVDVTLEVTINGNLTLRVGQPTRTGPRCAVTGYKRQVSRSELTCDVRTNNQALTSAKLIVFGRLSRTRLETDLPISLLQKESEADSGLLHFEVRARLDLLAVADAMPEIDDILDVFLEVVLEGREDPYQLVYRWPEAYPEHKLRSTGVETTHGGEARTHLFIPYLTYRSHRLAYRVEHFRTVDYRYLRRLLPLSGLFSLVKPFTRIWLVGEVPYKAQDNGLHFFRYLRRSRPRLRAYYVIDSQSPDRDKILPLGNVIDRSSRRHILYSLLASRLVCTHHAEYLFASRDRPVSKRTRGVRIFLQHGVTAMKNVTPIYARQRTYELPAERFLVVSDLERRIVTEDYGYRPRQVPVTGFARYDELFAAHRDTDPTVLVMPTWREGLRADNFLETTYYQNWHGFLTDPALQVMLEAQGLRITLVLHPNLRTFAEFFDTPNVDLIRQEDVDVQALITSSRVLITDFSSVAWDFSFLRRPVLYFQFDQEMLAGARAPHIDFAEQLPGPVITTVARLVAELASLVDRECAMSDDYWMRAQLFLKYRDEDNCARIFDAVDRAWRPSTLIDRVINSRSVQRWWWRFRRGPRYFPWVRRLYRLAAHLPRANEVVFECDRGGHYGDAPRYLYERLIEREKRPNVVWANNTTLRLSDQRTRKIARHSPRYYWHLGRARYWVNNQNFSAQIAKPAGTTFLQTWHGTPLKRMQHDVENMLSRDAEYQRRAARLTGYWDVLLSGSPYATACFRSAFRYQGAILEVGYPRNDVFSWPDVSVRARYARERLGLGDDSRKVLLYAPTFRDDNRRGVNWKHKLELDVTRLENEFSEEYVLVVRFHQLVRESIADLTAKHPEFVIDASAYNDIQELMLISDVLITDYSSVFFDYSVLRRPILFFTYDLDRYRDVLRGFYLDFESVAPGPLLRDNDELVGALRNLERVEKRYQIQLEEFAATYAPLDDGGASDRVLDAFFDSAYGTPSPDDAPQRPAVPPKIEAPR